MQYDNGEEVALLYTEKDTVRYVLCSYTQKKTQKHTQSVTSCEAQSGTSCAVIHRKRHKKTLKYTQSGKLYIDTATEKDTARYVVRSYT